MILGDIILFAIGGAMILLILLINAFIFGRAKEQKARENKVLQAIIQNTVDSIRIDDEGLKCYMVLTLTSGVEYVVSEKTYYLNPDVICLPNSTTINKNNIATIKRHYLGTGIMYSQIHSSEELMNFPVFLVGDSETDIKKVYTEVLGRETYRSSGRYKGIVYGGNNISWSEDIFDSFWEEKYIIRNENDTLY